MMVALQNSNRELDEFAYVASHDLKAPLRVIDNASAWLEEDLGEQLQGDDKEHLNLVRSRVKRMEKLLDDLLEYARIGKASHKHHMHFVEANDIIENAIQMVNKPEGFEIVVQPLYKTIELQPMPMQQIFMNLINNAIKHHDKPQGIIYLGLEIHKDHYTMSVKDNGPGFEEKYYNQVFHLFKTLKSRDQVEGSGMGLAIVKKHINLAGGHIWIESTLGQGTSFYWTWPKEGVQHVPEAQQSHG